MASEDDDTRPHIQIPKSLPKSMSDREWQAFFEEQDAAHDQPKQCPAPPMDPALYNTPSQEAQRVEKVVPPKPDTNPFVAFRRFIDSNVHAFAESLNPRPSPPLDPNDPHDFVTRPHKLQHEQYQRWTGDSEGSECLYDRPWDSATAQEREKGSTTLGMLMGRSIPNKGFDVNPSDVAALWHDEEPADTSRGFLYTPGFSVGAPDSNGDMDITFGNADDRPPTGRPNWWAPRFLSPSWFRKSEYSPIALDDMDDLGGPALFYRMAFEDLLLTSMCRPRQPIQGDLPHGMRWPDKTTQYAWEAPGVDWMLSLYCRRILPWPLGPDGEGINLVVNELKDAVVTKSKSRVADYRETYKRFPKLRERKGERISPESFAAERFGAGTVATERLAAEGSVGEGRWRQEAEALGLDEELEEESQELREILDREFTLEEWAVILEDMRSCFDDESDPPLAREDQRGELQALGKHRKCENASAHPASLPREEQRQEETKEQPKVSVLSALTTTHTTRLPDGTVTTKVVLKQRFSDGREECEEKVHTYQEQPQRDKSEHEPQQENGEQRKSGGWFWT